MGILGNARASIPPATTRSMHNQGMTIDGVNFDGQLKFMFAIYTASMFTDMVWDGGGGRIFCFTKKVPVSFNGRYLVFCSIGGPETFL